MRQRARESARAGQTKPHAAAAAAAAAAAPLTPHASRRPPQVTDNSGAKLAQVINQSGKSWGIGDIITVAIKRSQPRSKIAAGSVRRGSRCVERGRARGAGALSSCQARARLRGTGRWLSPRGVFGRANGVENGPPKAPPSGPPPRSPPPAPTAQPPHALHLPSSFPSLSLLLLLQVQKAVITETVKELRRPDGSSIGFARNACVLVNAKGAPLGTRVLGFAAHELRARGLLKVLSLTARVL